MNITGMRNQPWLIPAVALIGGLLIGWFVLGYLFPTFSFVNADPWDLRATAKEQWISMTADSYSLNGDKTLAKDRMRGIETDAGVTLTKLIGERTQQGRPLEAQRLMNFANAMGYPVGAAPATGGQPPAGATPATKTTAGGSAADTLGSLLPLFAVIALLLAAALLAFFLLRRPNGLALAGRGAGGVTRPAPLPTTQPTGSAPVATAPRSAPAAAAPAPAAATGAKPIFGTFAATYKFGDDNYDTSFSLETPRGDFLGETGMGVSEVIGEGKPDKVTAFDLWLFDKGDVRTVTKILMSDYAYNDQALRTKLATKGELVMAEKGKRILLETATMRVEAEIADLVYASTPGLAPNSHFQKLIVEMVPAQK